jgi:hypothetical protein
MLTRAWIAVAAQITAGMSAHSPPFRALFCMREVYSVGERLAVASEVRRSSIWLVAIPAFVVMAWRKACMPTILIRALGYPVRYWRLSKKQSPHVKA